MFLQHLHLCSAAVDDSDPIFPTVIDFCISPQFDVMVEFDR